MNDIVIYMSSISRCKNYKIPLIIEQYNTDDSIGKQSIKQGFKPVFPLEKEIYKNVLERHLGFPVVLPDNTYRSGNRLYCDGNLLAVFRFNNLKLEIKGKKTLTRERYEKIKGEINYFKKIIEANKDTLKEKEEEAINFITKSAQKYKDRKLFISFSGGKDSAVVAHLVKKALGQIPLLFANTTIEFPETEKYVRDFAEKFNFDLVEVKPPRNFIDLVDELGPPSRMMRWCCFTQKSSPINNYYRKLDSQVLSFEGIRKSESKRRTQYKRLRKSTKMIKQVSAYPILEWSDFDVWLYILSHSIPMNPLYLYGFSRVGCWACPNQGKLSEFFTNYYHPDLIKKWEQKLLEYAKNNGKDKKWVKEGVWKSRKTKYKDVEVVTKSFNNEQNRIVYRFKKERVSKETVQFLKIFGRYSESKENGSESIKIKGEDIKISTSIGSEIIKIELTKNNGVQAKKRFEKQIEKALNCIKCGACLGSCSKGAITIEKDKYRINEDLCNHCGTCTTCQYLDRACISLHYLSNRERIDRSQDNSNTIHRHLNFC